MNESFLTREEEQALQTSGLSRKTPFAIRGVSHGYFSVARHYGAASYNGSDYTYDPTHDELVRDDVLKWATERRKPAL